ncbi:putative ZmL1 non-LTR retrotransposon protein [Senna tora]|uniref:Putative ZmL1 non-LTR retrotransposon protein n=1 Tax=Senna tora TaxID=362788 RepID=A0A834WAW6_9FABA|nr:putative ZmL1 non-LTR retrotransposon protein [Senna tora]
MVDRQDNVISTVHHMEIGWPTNVQHITHVTFDSFNGFLVLPVEFEVEILGRFRCEGREALKKGLVRRIGDGTKTNVFNTPWIPSIENFSIPHNINNHLGADLRVSDLIVQETNMWNSQLIMQAFEPEVSKAILCIPLSRRGGEDIWMWSLTGNGIFSVKTAYKTVHKSYEASNGWSKYKKVWKRVWNMKVTPNTRNFMWRACRNILPTCTNLKGRGMDLEDICFLCNEGSETIFHALCDCPTVQDFWRQVGVVTTVTEEGTYFADWFESKLKRASAKEVEVMCLMMHRIWNRRNKLRLGEEAGSLLKCWDEVNALWCELNEGRKDELSHDGREAEVSAKWDPPHWSNVKVNVDAGYDNNSDGRIGCVIRNYNGRCLAAKLILIPGVQSIEYLEALAILEGIKFAKEMNCNKIEVEGDCKKVYDLLLSSKLDLSYLRLIVENILDFKSQFDLLSFKWASRDANMVAHTLVKADFNFSDVTSNSVVWLEDFPSIICNVLLSDCSYQ